MQTDLVYALFETNVPKTVKLDYPSQVVVLSLGCYVRKHVEVHLIVVIEYRTQGRVEVEVRPLIQLKVSQRCQYPTLHTYSIHLHCVLAQLGSHYKPVNAVFLGPQRLNLSESVAARVRHHSVLANVSRKIFLNLSVEKVTLLSGGRCSKYPQVPILSTVYNKNIKTTPYH